MVLGLAVKTAKKQKMMEKKHKSSSFLQKTGAFQELSV